MDIGVITVRDSDYPPNRRLLEAADKRGCALGLVDPYRAGPWIFRGRPGMGGALAGALPRVVLPRQGAQIGASSLTVLSQFMAMKVPLVNNVAAIRTAANKFLTLQALAACGLPVPDTVFAHSARLFYAAMEHLNSLPLVVKKLSSRQGKDVFLLENSRDADQLIIGHMETGQGLLLQEFIPPEGRTDLRVLVIGEKIAGAMALAPAEGDFRSNFHVSGQSRPYELSREIAQMALAAARAVGLDIAGVDIILDHQGAGRVIEVNYAPGFRGLEAATGEDMAVGIIDFCLSRARKTDGVF
ncbi:MAG: RimK family alpha-L-glutamate ligase [Desulfobacterales bacterium]|nr:RimK family alpha-L-glutamate ligase [Desulfobacterales bacterium]